MTSGPVAVNPIQCERLSAEIRNIDASNSPIPRAMEQAIYHSLPSEVIQNAYFTIVAICHQTTPYSGPRLEGYIEDRLVVGWDYLLQKWLIAVRQDHDLVAPHRLRRFTGNDIRMIVHDSVKGDTITVADGRADLLNDIGRCMIINGWQSIHELWNASEGRIFGTVECAGLLDRLKQFQAYSQDPVQKKSYYFLALMMNQGIWTYRDSHNLGSPVDYHEVRGHLRYGTVTVLDDQLPVKLFKREAG